MSGYITSEIKKVLKDIHSTIGNIQVTISRFQSSPSSITYKALQEEHVNIWAQAYREVYRSIIPKHSNFTPSHFFYNIKTEETGYHRLKALIFPNSNRHKIKYQVLNYSATAQFNFLRLILTLATFSSMRMVVVYINVAQIQIVTYA